MWWENDIMALNKMGDALEKYIKTNPDYYFPGKWSEQNLYALDEQLWAEIVGYCK